MMADLQAPLEQVHQGGEHNVLFRLAHFEYRKGMISLRSHIQREQHGAVDPTALCILHPQIHTLVICLHVVAELRLQHHTSPSALLAALQRDLPRKFECLYPLPYSSLERIFASSGAHASHGCALLINLGASFRWLKPMESGSYVLVQSLLQGRMPGLTSPEAKTLPTTPCKIQFCMLQLCFNIHFKSCTNEIRICCHTALTISLGFVTSVLNLKRQDIHLYRASRSGPVQLYGIPCIETCHMSFIPYM